MFILIDENNVVISWVECGGITSTFGTVIEVDDIPDEVKDCPSKWIYDNGSYVENPDYQPYYIEKLKTEKIQYSKESLAEWLANNPMQFTDGKYYSVTEEKQALLNGNLASYERATQAGIPYPLKWNSTGDECVDWTYENLLLLSLSIAGYVAPKVSMQQSYEIQIKACTTIEELDRIVIDYN